MHAPLLPHFSGNESECWLRQSPTITASALDKSMINSERDALLQSATETVDPCG
jgi:hypothetical protein